MCHIPSNSIASFSVLPSPPRKVLQVIENGPLSRAPVYDCCVNNHYYTMVFLFSGTPCSRLIFYISSLRSELKYCYMF
jgi:hypothetical protein